MISKILAVEAFDQSLQCSLVLGWLCYDLKHVIRECIDLRYQWLFFVMKNNIGLKKL